MDGGPAADPAWRGGWCGPHALAVLCPNPGPMTLEGTNTWVLAAPGSSEAIVIDPGPLDHQHLDSVLHVVADREARVALTLLTHHHHDHAESADRFATLTGAPVRAIGSGHDDLHDGELVRAAGLEVLVVATPGHTADSISFLLAQDNLLLTGDTVLGRGTTVVAHPDGRLADYLASLERLERLTGSGQVTSIGPGHGPVVPDAAGTVRYYLRHRHERLDQVREAVSSIAAQGGHRPVADLADLVVRGVYADVPRAVWPAARLSVLAQLDYLGLTGRGDATDPGR